MSCWAALCTTFALAMPVAALCLAPWGARQAGPHLHASTVAAALGLALLMPVLPYALELAALRRIPARSFATLMSFEPLVAVVAGAAVLGQRPRALAGLGIVLGKPLSHSTP